MNYRKVLGLLVWVLLLPGCAAHRGLPSTASDTGASSEDPLAAAYAEALEKAKFPSAEKIDKNLVALTGSSPDLVFNDQGQILMVSYTKAAYFPTDQYVKGYVFPLYGTTWFTAAPYLKNFCTDYSEPDLSLRIKQLLGMPPNASNDSVASFWVNLQDIFRPCPDPEVTDHECVVSLADGDPNKAALPWQWVSAGQTSRRFVKVSQEHLEWMYNYWVTSYAPTELYSKYPWTALGYTYDWGNPDSAVGMSEFVCLKDTQVVFESIESLDAYCGR